MLVPSIALVAQMLGAWGAGCPVDRVLAVCSDWTAGRGGVSRSDLAVPVSTDPEFIAKWVAGTAGRALIAGTYDSAARIAEACGWPGRRRSWRCATRRITWPGRRARPPRRPCGRGSCRPGGSCSSPRPRGSRSGVGSGGELAVASMDDEALFGRPVFTYPAGRAISEGWLKDYRLVVAAMSDASCRAAEEEPARWRARTACRCGWPPPRPRSGWPWRSSGCAAAWRSCRPSPRHACSRARCQPRWRCCPQPGGRPGRCRPGSSTGG